MHGGDLKRRFGRKVQELREARGLTQEQLAAQIGRSVDTVSNIERGINATRIETAYQLAAALEVRLPDLFNFDDELEPSERERRIAIREIIELLGSRDPGTIARIRDLIEVGLRLTDAE